MQAAMTSPRLHAFDALDNFLVALTDFLPGVGRSDRIAARLTA